MSLRDFAVATVWNSSPAGSAAPGNDTNSTAHDAAANALTRAIVADLLSHLWIRAPDLECNGADDDYCMGGKSVLHQSHAPWSPVLRWMLAGDARGHSRT